MKPDPKIEDATLLCPECGGINLHHDEVQVYFRQGEDKPGTRSILQNGATSTVNTTTGFAGRRSDVRIRFSCEGCPAISWLYIIQHKGSTITKWLDHDKGDVYAT